MFDIARFLLEAGSYQELEDVLEVAQSAYERLDANERDPTVIDQYHSSKGTMLAQRGLFEEAKPHQIHTLKLRQEATPLDRFALSWAEVNMGNLLASMTDYDTALDYEIKALRNFQTAGRDNIDGIKAQAVFYQNLGRCMWLAGRLKEAHIWCHIAISIADSQSWAMLA